MSHWNSFRTDEPLGITAGITTFTGGGGKTIHAYVARPSTPGPHPGVVNLHHMPGWDEYYQEVCERLARHGYIVICPNLFESLGQGTPVEIATTAHTVHGVHDDAVVADAEAALRWLQEQSDYSGKAGVVGECSGGRHAVLVGSLVPGFAAIADLWGGGVIQNNRGENPNRPVLPAEYTEKINIPLLGIFGNDDQSPTPAQVNEHEELLKQNVKDYEFHRYDGAGHSFFGYDRPNYRQEQAMDGWEKLLNFFDRTLKSKP